MKLQPLQSCTRKLKKLSLPGCALVLLSLVVLGACRTARLLAEDKASDADLSGMHSIDLSVLQKLTEFPNCIASCAFGAPLWLRLTAVRGYLASTRVGYRSLLSNFIKQRALHSSAVT